MCGIFGVWDRGRPVDVGAVQAAVASMRHRGPDDEGYVLIDTASGRAVPCGGDDTPASLGLPHVSTLAGERFDLALGHRRLAILDTSPRGHQPMTDGSNWIVHSGEIFNYLELASGAVTTDTEVLLALVGQEGAEAFARCDGMWASAVWLADRRRLVCSRDRFGIKPLLIRDAPARFVFASQAGAIRAYEGARPDPDEGAMADYLAWGMTDHDARTFDAGVRSLAPAHVLEVGIDGRKQRRYWALPGRGAASVSPDQVRAALEASVTRRLRSDVPVGTLLSGGIDSSSITCLIRSALGPEADLHTFTVGFDDPAIDERRHADVVARSVGARNATIVLDGGDLLEVLPELLLRQEGPVVSASAYAQWKVVEAAKQMGVTVLLDGQGGDEVFSGYPQASEIALRTALLGGHLGHALRMAKGSGATTDAIRAALRRAPGRLRRLPGWLRPDAPVTDGWRYPSRATLPEVMANDLRFRLPSLLRLEERSAMAFGVEVRVPFLDHRVVELAVDLDDAQRIRDGRGKAILRDAMRGVVPDAILDRRDKIGFRTPDRAWLESHRPEVVERILWGPVMDLPFVQGDVVRRMLAAGESGPQTWRLLCVTVWLDAAG